MMQKTNQSKLVKGLGLHFLALLTAPCLTFAAAFPRALTLVLDFVVVVEVVRRRRRRLLGPH